MSIWRASKRLRNGRLCRKHVPYGGSARNDAPLVVNLRSLFDSIEEGFVGVPLRYVLRAFSFYAADGSRPDSQPCRDIALQKSRPLPPCGKAGTGGMPRSCR